MLSIQDNLWMWLMNSTDRDDDDRLLRAGQVMELASISRSTLEKLLKAGEFPVPVAVGGWRRWWRSEVLAYLEARPRVISDVRKVA